LPPKPRRSGSDDADLRRGHAKHAREAAMHVVRHLGRGPQRELAFAVERGDRRVLLDRQMGVAFVEEQVLEDVIRSCERSSTFPNSKACSRWMLPRSL